jgi:hypothetical protein
MKKKNKSVIGNLFFLSVILAVVFFIHGYLQVFIGKAFLSNHILEDYLFNFTLTLIFFVMIEVWKEKLLPNLGYVFLFFSLVKFILFLVILYPNYNVEDKLKSAEFVAFFTPYAICMFFETTTLIRRLNSADQKE